MSAARRRMRREPATASIRRMVAPAWLTLASFLWSTLHPSMAWAVKKARNNTDTQAQAPASTHVEQPQPKPPTKKNPDLSASPRQGGNFAKGEPAPATTNPLPSVVSLPKADNGISTQAISVPSGAGTPGGMGESFSAQLTTGIATLTVPFAVPSPRGSAEVSLGLAYSSTGGQGVAGVGWSLVGEVAIARQTDRGIPRYDDRSDWHPQQDRFVFGAQELVPICMVSGSSCTGALAGEVMPVWAQGWQYFRARIEGGFLRFFWSPDHKTWRVQSKDGMSLELGVPLDGTGYVGGLETNPLQPAEIYRWRLVRTYDSRGDISAMPLPRPVNVVLYRYANDGAITYLSDVFHTSPVTDPHTTDLSKSAHHARLVYEARPDASTSFRAGFAQEQRLRLRNVDVASKPFANGAAGNRELVRRYHLSYETDKHASLLSTVEMEGRCATPVTEASDGSLGPTGCPRLPAQSFEYAAVSGPNPPLTDSQGLAYERLNETVKLLSNSPPHSLDESNTSLVDINADSLPDVLVTAPHLFTGKHGLFLNGSNGQLSFSTAQTMTVTGIPSVDGNILKLSNTNVAGLDLDGDAQVDLVHMPVAKQYSVFTPKNVAGQWTWQGRAISTASGLSPKIDFANNSDRIVVMDVNADGLVDVVFSSAQELQTFFSLGRYPDGDGRFGSATLTAPDAATFSDEPVTACIPWSASPIQFNDGDVRIADMNGDGLPDIARVRSGQVFYWPGRGNGYWGTGDRDACKGGNFGQDRHVAMQNAPNFGVAQPGTLELADVNGDGLTDLVEIRFDAVDVYLNANGTAWTARQVLSKVPIKPNVGNIVRIADIDGSGTVDLVWGQGYDYRYVDLAGGIRPNILVRTHNGLGKTTDFEYSTSTQLMLEAEKAGSAWSRVMPLTVPVVVRSTVRDNLDKIGRSPGIYTTEYGYRDPVFDGRQREFRGFSIAETRTLGDANSPTATTRSTFLMGECRAAQSGLGVCSPGERWKDNWREPLKGAPVLVETFDEAGVYLSTAHTTYDLRQLYSGRDGRRVSVAFTVAQDAFAYDTSPFVPAAQPVVLDEVQVNLTGIVETETRNVTRRGAGAVRMRARHVLDLFGNQLESIAEGCTEGCASADEVITTHASYMRPPGDATGWLFRPESTFISGSVHTAPRNQIVHEYDARGDVVRTTARLSGTLFLDRFHATGGAFAPNPPDASGGVSSPVDIALMRYSRDLFGNAVSVRGAVDRCRDVAFDTAYAELPVTETTFAGERGSDGCGTRALSSSASYDRGFALLAHLVGVSGQPVHFDYDEFGRVVAKTLPDPAIPGQLSPLPTVTYSYFLPTDPSTSPVTTMVARSQDGSDPANPEYYEAYTFVDGLGRPLVTLSEADATAGDGGDWVVSGVVDYDAKGAPARAYENWFHTGAANTFSLSSGPTTDSSRQQYDAFGRPIAQYGLDGQLESRTDYHALSQDVWDPEDLTPGPHQSTFSTVGADGHGRSVRTAERIRVGGVLQAREMLREYLPSGEVLRTTQRAPGVPDTVRWMRYDSLGRLVLNGEPNTSVGFTASPTTDPSAIKAWRYAYNDAGDLVGASDARGCGVNYHFEAAGRMVAEDYSPCESGHAVYTPVTNLANGGGAEAFYRYDLPDPETGAVVDAAGHTLPVSSGLLRGRLVSVADRGSKGLVRYDARGRVTGNAIRMAQPGGANPALASSYAPRWYIQDFTLDAADRTEAASTGATVTELLGASGQSVTMAAYSRRGVLNAVGSSYGTLLASQAFAADGLMTGAVFGDAANTQRAYSFDQLRRLRSVQTYRAGPDLWTSPSYTPATDPTQQLLLEDCDFTYDQVGNITELKDWRTADDWPSGSKPVNRKFEYDDIYRLTRVRYDNSAGGDAWTSPFAAENSDPTRQPQPSPHVDFQQRVKEQRYSYDHLGNTTRTTDDSSGFYDRSLGNIGNGAAAIGPHQLRNASNRNLSPTSPRKGDLSTEFDAAGNLTKLIVRRDGPCLPSGVSCWQRFSYEWDELGRLAEAKRWDLAAGAERTNHASIASLPPARTADVRLRYVYDASGQRTLKTAVDAANNESHSVYIFPTLELRKTWWTAAAPGAPPDYALTPATQSVLLPAGGAQARVIYAEEDLPSQTSGNQHVFMEFTDHLGSTTFIVDHGTGELVEHSTYMAYGSADSDYRPGRWGEFREPYKFSGKEEDVEVGLSYFGARYLVVALGRWASADPATVHFFRADPNPYAYVAGRPVVSVDPNGNEPITLAVILTAAAAGAIIGAAVGAGANFGIQWYTEGDIRKVKPGQVVIAAGAGAVGGAVGGAVFPVASPAIGAFGATVLAGTASGPAGYITHSGLSGTSITWKGILISAAVGAVTGVVLYGAARVFKPSSGPKPAAPSKPPGPTAGTPPPSTPAPAAVTGGAGKNAPGDPWEGTFKLPQKPDIAPPTAAPTPRSAPQPPRAKLDLPRSCNEGCMAARACFAAGTLVLTATGALPIESIHIGDSVWAYDFRADTWGWYKVEKALQHPGPYPTISVSFDPGATVVTTRNHPFCVLNGPDLAERPSVDDLAADDRECAAGGRWVQAGDLREGDQVANAYASSLVVRVRPHSHVPTVFNLHVSGARTFAVSQIGLLVHNKPAVKVFGENGARTTSTTVWRGQGRGAPRIDVENPAPGQRPGQIHYQHGESKYLYDPVSDKFVGAPNRVNEALKDPAIRRGIDQALRILGEF